MSRFFSVLWPVALFVWLGWLLRRERDPVRAAAWWLVAWFFPVGGVVGWWLLRDRHPASPSGPRRGSGRPPENGSPVERLIERGCGAPRRNENRVTLLHNASNAFSALIATLQRARRSISVAYYIVCDDRIGRTVADILMRRARAGVRVRMIYDAFGSRRLGRPFIERLRRAGVEVRPYAPLRFPWFTARALRRNHRKVVVVDGCRALLGGINLATYYLEGNRQGSWRDEHLLIEGSAAGDLERLFSADGRQAGGTPFSPQRPSPAPCGRSPLQIAWAGRGSSRQTLTEAYTTLIVRARRTVRLASPYFIPPPELLRALRCAVGCGVRVQVMVPRQSDSPLLDLVAESYIDDLLAAGVELYRYGRGFLHAKFMVVDDALAAVGTANMDYRSLNLNEEVVAFLYDRRPAAELAAVFDGDLLGCETVTPENWHPRWWRRCLGEGMRLAAPLL